MSACHKWKFTIALFILSLLATTVSQAQCPQADQVEVTIIQGRSGKVMTLCVPPNAIDRLGGDNDIMIPAKCPADVTLLESNVEWVNYDQYRCEAYEWFYVDALLVDAIKHDTDETRILYVDYSWYQGSGRTAYYIEYGSESPPEILWRHFNLTPDQAKACAAQIWGFAVRELGLDCVGEFPDFEPN